MSSSTVSDSQSSNNQNSSAVEDVKQQVNSNENEPTQRQQQSSFQPSNVTFVYKNCPERVFSSIVCRMLNKWLINFNR